MTADARKRQRNTALLQIRRESADTEAGRVQIRGRRECRYGESADTEFVGSPEDESAGDRFADVKSAEHPPIHQPTQGRSEQSNAHGRKKGEKEKEKERERET